MGRINAASLIFSGASGSNNDQKLPGAADPNDFRVGSTWEFSVSSAFLFSRTCGTSFPLTTRRVLTP